MTSIRTLAISDGGAPNALQRQELFTTLLEGKAKSAVVTSVLTNRLKRGIATAIFWLNPNFRAYPPDQFDNALAHLEVSDHREAVLRTLREMGHKLAPLDTLKAIEG
ncbi:hypothetical protein ENSA5_03940 [Enhygromyxa salina]|uniref:Uncharacterized protein n=1 Tax=Enhygromyxa salina TaxID=215803 RepID=A0A2S9YJJ8_9BACT|nr:hypothetical protein ENSA5_03940 [Enhygromyxa salina]